MLSKLDNVLVNKTRITVLNIFRSRDILVFAKILAQVDNLYSYRDKQEKILEGALK